MPPTLTMQKRLPVSVCIISGAEAHRIGRTLESVATWTREIIVVLNEEVHDGTEQIALKFGAKVFREPWKGFVAQKNSAQAKASEPWVLGLDADEVISPELQKEMADRLTTGVDSYAAYRFPRCTLYFGRWIRHGDWYPDRCVRLWKRDCGRWGGIDPHAAPEISGSLGDLKHDLLHYTADTINHQVIKTMNYADDFVQHCARTGKRVSLADLLARPTWRFIRAYFLKLGFLDGWQGYAIAWLTAFYTFLRYVRAREATLKPPGDR